MVIEKKEKEKIPGEKFAGKLEECAKRLVIKERDGYKKRGRKKKYRPKNSPMTLY